VSHPPLGRARPEGEEMTGHRPAGLPWTRGEEDQLRAMLEAGMKTPAIALKLRRQCQQFVRESYPEQTRSTTEGEGK